MKKLILVCLVVLMTGCGHGDKFVAGLTGYSNVCVNGVNYLQFTSGVTVQYDKTGKVVECK
jgi:hypothetical protein